MERQNAALRQSAPLEEGGGKPRPLSGGSMMEASLIDLDTLDGSEGDWLIGEPGLVGPGDEVDWLRSDLEDSPVVSVKKKSLVNKLDDLCRGKSPYLK